MSSGSARVATEVKKFTLLNDTISNVRIYDTEGNQQFALQTNRGSSLSPATASTFTTIYQSNNQGIYTSIIEPYFNSDGQHPYAIAYTISTAQLEQSIHRSTETIIFFALIGLLLTAAVTYWLIDRLFLRPIEAVSRASLAISHGNYDQQIMSQRNDEIGDLSLSVNQMATTLKQDIFKLQEVDTMKNEFIMITSHNLRTPLTIIEGYMEMIRDSELPGDLRKMIDSIEDGLKRLASFSEDILTIASIESGKASVTTKNTTIANLLEGIRETYESACEQSNLTLEWHVDAPDTIVEVSVPQIRGVLRNLLDNAVKFTSKGGKVGLFVITEGNDLLLTVKDTGIGISPEEMSKLFTKFHRGTSTLKYNYEGTGIGLYASKLIVQAQHGTVTAASTLGKGSTFIVQLPNAVITEK
jgi:signal transduction histidine kinase